MSEEASPNSESPSPAAKPSSRAASPGNTILLVFAVGILIGAAAAIGFLLIFTDGLPTSTNAHRPAPSPFDNVSKRETAFPDLPDSRQSSQTQVAPAAPRMMYYLDVGKYASLQEADALKAKLALLGMESKVEPRTGESPSSYRLKVGPYFNNVEVNIDKAELAMNGIRSELVQTTSRPASIDSPQQ